MILTTKTQNEIKSIVVDFSSRLMAGEKLDTTSNPAAIPSIINTTSEQDIVDTFTATYTSVDTDTNRIILKLGRGGVIGDVYLIKCSYPTLTYTNMIEEQVEVRVI